MTTDDTLHLTAEDVAAYLDRRMTPNERNGVELHLADCQVCRGEVADVRRLLITSPVGRRAMLLPAGLLAAAAIAFIVITFNNSGEESPGDRVRTPPAALPTDFAQRLAVYAPADGDTVARGRLALSWSSLPGEPTYRVTLTDASGQPVWSSTTPDTSATVPAHVVLQPRTTYFWYVDALKADGRAASTGVRRFSIP